MLLDVLLIRNDRICHDILLTSGAMQQVSLINRYLNAATSFHYAQGKFLAHETVALAGPLLVLKVPLRVLDHDLICNPWVARKGGSIGPLPLFTHLPQAAQVAAVFLSVCVTPW